MLRTLSVCVVVAGFWSSQSRAAGCPDSFRIQFFGDFFVSQRFDSGGENFLSELRPVLKKADFNVVNLEGVLSDHDERAFPDFPFSLKMNEIAASVLSAAGISYVTRANNHSMDYGVEGLEDTDAALKKNKIRWTGSGKDVTEATRAMIFEKNGYKVGILAFTTTLPQEAWANSKKPGVAYPTEMRLRNALRALKKETDFSIVTFHWGEERVKTLRPHQVALADIALEAGADAVLGHHAHVAQAVSKISDKWVFYGIGNFVFTSNSPFADLGLGLRYEFCPSDKTQHKVGAFGIDTLASRTGFVSRPMSVKETRERAASYFEEKAFPLDIPLIEP